MPAAVAASALSRGAGVPPGAGEPALGLLDACLLGEPMVGKVEGKKTTADVGVDGNGRSELEAINEVQVVLWVLERRALKAK